MSNEAGELLLILGGLVVIFLICREIVLWYWKVNRIVALLEEISDQLEDVLKKS